MAGELVQWPVSVLVATGGEPAALAAKAATSSVPIVFAIGGDPIDLGLVASYNRPGPGAAAHVMGANVEGLFVGLAPFWLSARTEITAMVARLKLPAVYGWREFADAGGLMSYGCNLPDNQC
jgi:uncharacterized YccA/Bax inhibitor family protein